MDGWFDTGVLPPSPYIIKPALVFMVESHPVYLLVYSFLMPESLTHTLSLPLLPSSLLSARDTGLLNLETLYLRLRAAHVYIHVRVGTRSLRFILSRRGSNLLRFISASKLMVEALPLCNSARSASRSRLPTHTHTHCGRPVRHVAAGAKIVFLFTISGESVL